MLTNVLNRTQIITPQLNKLKVVQNLELPKVPRDNLHEECLTLYILQTMHIKFAKHLYFSIPACPPSLPKENRVTIVILLFSRIEYPRKEEKRFKR